MREIGRGVSVVWVAGVISTLAGAARAAWINPERSRVCEPECVPAADVLSALARVASRDSDPASRRGTLLMRLRSSPLCYAADLTPEQMERLIAETDLLPPTLGQSGLSTRFYTDTFVWNGDGGTGPSARAQPAHLTYSFPDDGTMWGLSGTSRTAANELNAKLVTTFGDLDRGREYIRSAIACWRRYSSLTYDEVADDNTLMTGSSTRVATRGDVRIGGFSFATDGQPNGMLAYNGFPTALGASSVSGGDMAINTAYFIPSTFQLALNDYRYFRNTVSHEHGHGVGCIHSIPCDQTKLMEPTISGAFNMLQRDEIRAAQRNYGDRFAGNQSFSTAYNLGDLTQPSLRSVFLRNLSTNGSTGFGLTGEDYFRFTISSPQSVNIAATPIGESSSQGQQTGACVGTQTVVDSLNAGNLRIELRDTLNAVIASASSQPSGQPETLSFPALAAGTYTILIKDGGGTAAANQFVQNYDLLVRVGTALVPPDPIAGLNKRVRAGTPAWFLGGINSLPVEPGATLPASGFDWDFDGDGVMDVEDSATASFIYPSNGAFQATLRLTDSNGLTATDTINVTVFGALTNVASVSPPSGTPGEAAPVTIIGSNFKGVTSASQVTVTGGGGGVTVSGTPVVNRLGTRITGLTFTVAPAAVSGPRTVTVTNSDGQGAVGTGVGVFTVGMPPGPPPNDECSGAIDWGSLLGLRPFNNFGATRSASQTFTGTGCPAAGPIENDVWFTWSPPASGVLSVNTDSASVGFQSRVALYRSTAGCPPVQSAFRCDDFGVAFTLSVTAGATYLFQVGSVSAGATGTANVILNLNATQGSCCMPSGACSITADTGCPGGEWFFSGTCAPNLCFQPTGACCASGVCSITDYDACLNIPGVWRGPDTVCGSPDNPIGCCPANFNQAGGVTIQDLFDYLGAWFANAPEADFNHDSSITLQDLFDFLGAWFAGC